ncbi:hypothetical protein D3C81_1171180 [compost metagenome]
MQHQGLARRITLLLPTLQPGPRSLQRARQIAIGGRRAADLLQTLIHLIQRRHTSQLLPQGGHLLHQTLLLRLGLCQLLPFSLQQKQAEQQDQAAQHQPLDGQQLPPRQTQPPRQPPREWLIHPAPIAPSR